MSSLTWNNAGLQAPGLEVLHRHWGWFLALGVVMLMLGLISISAAMVTTLLSVALIGWLLLVGGAMLVVQAFWTRRWSGFFMYLTVGLLYMILGLLLVSSPALAAVTLTLLIASFFIVGGLFRIISSLTHHIPQRGWFLFNGVISLLLGIMIWAQWPLSALWVIGTFVGIDLILSGWSYIMLATATRHLPPAQLA